MKKFAIIGVAGYIAPRHLKAIKDTGNIVVASMDPHDSVGNLDVYGFNDSAYFYDFALFERHVDTMKYRGNSIDYLSICSPNYLHDAHIRFGLKSGMDVICEKPILINPDNFDILVEKREKSGKKVSSILQLRLHPTIKELKNRIENGPKNHVYRVDLDYITVRGPWYKYSWKGNDAKSGGLAMNIGVHFFDTLLWIFGSVQDCKIIDKNDTSISGFLALEKAYVNWFLSLDKNNLPIKCQETKKTAYRKMAVDGEEIEFTDGFTDLHTLSYNEILAGNGFTLEDSFPSIKLVYNLRKGE